MIKQIPAVLLGILLLYLAACIQKAPIPIEVTAVSPTTPSEIRVESSYVLLPRDEMIKMADAIFAGQIVDISPTQFNQDSGEYWETTAEEGPGLGTTFSAWPVYFVELAVERPFVDKIGLGNTAVLTLLGNSPADAADPVNSRGEAVQAGGGSDWTFQVGDEIIAFVNQTEIAWWDGQPVRAVPYEDGFSFEIGRRPALIFANAPHDTYLLRQDNGRYASLPNADEPWPPLTLNEFAHEIALFRPVLTDGGVSLQITTPEPSPTPAICTPLPEGMTLTIKPASANDVTLELTGLQPGEQPHFIFTQEKPDGLFQMEEYDMPPVGKDGQFAHTMRLSSPYESPDWQIKIIHARGAACIEITLPLEETAVLSPELLTPPQVNCPDPQIDEMVGTLVEDEFSTVYTNPVLGIELIRPDKLCVHEPDYLFDHYGFTLSDPGIWEGVLLSVDWLYQAAPDQLETYVQESIDSFPELEVNREAITINGLNGVMLWPLPGTEATTQIYLAANDRLYRLIFWSAPLDEKAQALLNGLRFIEPTRSLDSLNLPQES